MSYMKPLTTGAVVLGFLVAAVPTAAADTSSQDLAGATVDGERANGSIIAVDTRDEPRDAGRVLGTLRPEGAPPDWPDSYKAGPWCNAQCITEGVAYEWGENVKLVVKTTVDAEIWISVTDGFYYNQATSPGMTTQFTWIVPNWGFEPGKTYFVTTTATDAYGNQSSASGSFTMPS